MEREDWNRRYAAKEFRTVEANRFLVREKRP